MSGVSETTQVTAVKAWTPRAENVFRSACSPAPAEQSEPAIVMAMGKVIIGDDMAMVARAQAV